MATTPDRTIIAQALDAPRLNLTIIGQASGAARTTLVKYRNGQRPMSEALRLRLAAYLDAHARRLWGLAQDLRR